VGPRRLGLSLLNPSEEPMLERVKQEAERLLFQARAAEEAGNVGEAVRLTKLTILANRQVREMRAEEA
jgi:hypothetical protein